MAIDFTLNAKDSKDIRIPVYTDGNVPVDLSAASIVWSLSEWLGAPAFLQKSRIAGDPYTEIGLEPAEGETELNQMVVKVLEDDVDVPAGIYVQHARVSFVNARDTVWTGIIQVLDSPGDVV